jgi:membrane-associated protease RseP (regulator of RpoE activity)
MKTRTSCWFALVPTVFVAATLLLAPDYSPAQEPAKEVPANRLPRQPKVVEVESGGEDFGVLLVQSFPNPAGVEVSPIDAALRWQLELRDHAGVIVTSIMPDGDAAKAGLEPHDIVLKIDETPIASPAAFNKLFSGEPGKKLNLSAIRKGKPLSIEITLAKPRVVERTYRPVPASSVLYAARPEPPSYRIGVTLAEADDTLRSQLKLASGEGLVVTDVLPDSPAAKAGIQRHDVLTKLDGKRLSSVEKINAQVQELKDRAATLAFIRGGQEKTCEVAAQLSAPADGRYLVDAWLREPVARSERMAAFLSEVGADSYPISRDGHSGRVRWHAAATPTPAGDQIAALKKQLAEMQMALESLEATLQAPAPNPESPEKKAEKK